MNYAPLLKIKASAELEMRRRERLLRDKYQRDPLGYAADVLKVNWWQKQQEIATALLQPPYRVLVKASHNVGKTFIGGGLVNWWFDSYADSITLTTAPTDRQVKDLLWKEVRVQRRGRSGFVGPKVPRLEYAANHFAHGYTARDSDSFQGHHAEHMLFIFDEAVGVAPEFWETTEGMFGGEGHAWLCIFNPTDTSSQAYNAELSGNWRTISVSMLEHPNILAESQGLPPPFPSAIRYARVDEMIREWCTPTADKRPTDIEWPFGSGQWWRPGPIAESRMLGRWPSQATYNVWSDAAWEECENVSLREGDWPCEIGCDVARFGDDFTEMHIRRGPVSLHHEAHNGWSTVQTAGRLKELARGYGQYCGVDGKLIQIKVDDDGVGGGVVDNADDYNFCPISAGTKAMDEERYPNRRSELWFSTAERAAGNQLSIQNLPSDIKRELRRQAMAPTWKLDSRGRRVVEPKDETKKRIKRSPDGMDAMNLAYAPATSLLL